MRVTRITIDADLGLIELRTGPGGDGDYVLLPIGITKDLERYIAFDRPESAEKHPEENRMPWYPSDETTERTIPMFATDGTPSGTIIMREGWSAPNEEVIGNFTIPEGGKLTLREAGELIAKKPVEEPAEQCPGCSFCQAKKDWTK